MDAQARERKAAELRHALLDLHKALLDVQKIEYERGYGRIETRNEFLGLVLNHPEFAWLRALSALIAELDEWAEGTEAETEGGYEAIVEALRGLVRRDSTANPEFSAKYWRMVEDQPGVTVAHVVAERIVRRSFQTG